MKSNHMDLFNENGAIFSNCREYRYALWRIWDKSKPYVMFIGLNPSTANEITDDPTIKRVQRFAHEWGFGGVYMLNCFPYISTNPTDLQDISPDRLNDEHLFNCSQLCNMVVFAWGSFDVVKDKGRDKELMIMFPDAMALIINRDGSPRHPLYVPTRTRPIHYAQSKIV